MLALNKMYEIIYENKIGNIITIQGNYMGVSGEKLYYEVEVLNKHDKYVKEIMSINLVNSKIISTRFLDIENQDDND